MKRLLLLTLFPAALSAQNPSPPASFAAVVRPFVEQHCQSCHNAKLQSGDINFEVLKYSTSVAGQPIVWETAAYVLRTEQMPPEGSPRPPKEDVKAVIEAIERDLAKTKAAPATNAAPPTREWLTWQADPERTGWARAEDTLSKQNVSGLKLLWKTQTNAVGGETNGYATLTDPLVVDNVQTKQGLKKLVFVASAENTVYALDAVTGASVWERKFPADLKPLQAATPNCPNGLNATPVVDKSGGMIYVLTNDGKLRGLGLADGDDRMAPEEFTAPYSRNWSLNLIDGVIYTSTSRGCGGAISNILAIDVKNPKRPIARFFPSTGKGSGPWGRGGIVKTPTGVIAQTADGVYDPAGGRFGNTFLGLSKDLRLLDSYTPANWDYLNLKDFDLGAASPTVFQFDKWTLVAAAAKEGVIYLLDAANLGGENHMTPLYVSPRYGNDALTFGYNGVWGSLSTWVDAKGERWLLVPMEGPAAKATAAVWKTSYGKVVNGSVMAFKVKVQNRKPVLEPAWMSRDLDLPGMPVVANGVVYVLATGDRARDVLRAKSIARPGTSRISRGPQNEVNVGEPGAERDAAWRSAQDAPGGQVAGRRFSGGTDLTHAVIFALDAETGKELYSSKDLIESWNHYGGVAFADGRLYMTTYDGAVHAFGLAK